MYILASISSALRPQQHVCACGRHNALCMCRYRRVRGPTARTPLSNPVADGKPLTHSLTMFIIVKRMAHLMTSQIFQEEFGRVRGHFGPINTVAFHPSGRRCVVCLRWDVRYSNAGAYASLTLQTCNRTTVTACNGCCLQQHPRSITSLVPYSTWTRPGPP